MKKMTRAEELDAAISELEEALVDLKALRHKPTLSRRSLQVVSAAVSGVVGRLARITNARYLG